MRKVERYNARPTGLSLTGMEQSETGDYVKFADYEKTASDVRCLTHILNEIIHTPLLFSSSSPILGPSIHARHPTFHGLTWDEIITQRNFPDHIQEQPHA